MHAAEWGKQYVTTLDTVDKEHRRLVDIAERNDEMLDVEDLLKAADEGVYLAKAAGRNCVRAAQSLGHG
ncbi:MAG: hypothetical protein AUK47_22360 [Deltaproteobacteria bacterium CG2_30_63_29]|nr:MAG: hypothetical protein AUK47_22360 [Deltaproteobacteria bacterium CG2_30_63_29]